MIKWVPSQNREENLDFVEDNMLMVFTKSEKDV